MFIYEEPIPSTVTTGYVPRHLLPGENPPSIMTQLMADTLPPWTDARTYGLTPSNVSISPNPPASAFDPNVLGSHWQRFVNAFAIELELLNLAIDDNSYAPFLEYPGYSRPDYDVVYSIALPSVSAVSTVLANDTAQYLSGVVDVHGNPILDPNRTNHVTLQPTTRMSDFFYGLSSIQQFVGDGQTTTFALNSRIGTNRDGSAQIEWVQINTVPVNNFVVGAGNQSITFLIVPNPGDQIVIHYTTYDVYYVLASTIPVLYVRQPYFEVCINSTYYTPVIHMIWNELDEIGLYLNKPRTVGEINQIYARRLLDAILYPSDSTTTGLRNALATELGLVTHMLWGEAPIRSTIPTVIATSNAVDLGTTVDPNSILLNRLPLPYYSVVTTSGQSGQVLLTIPALDLGQSYSTTIQCVATGGQVIPGLVPITFQNYLQPNAMGVYDQITVSRPTTLFSAPTNPWYSGSLQVWKNGVALTAGQDYVERSSTVFSLALPAQLGDVLQLGYIYDASVTPPELEAQPDILTDLSPIVRLSASYAADPIVAGTSAFSNWLNLPPNTDPATLPINGTWTMTITALNAGSAPSQTFNIGATLPALVTFENGYLTTNTLWPTSQDVRYIDTATVWVKNLTDSTLRSMLYDAQGAATPLLKAFAAEIATTSPLEWGQVKWDQTIWNTVNQHFDSYGYIPHLFDPDYQSQLTAQHIRYSGILSSNASGTDIFAQGAFGQTVAGNAEQPLFINFSLPGQAIGVSPVVRYPDFVSGIGDADDLQLSIATPSQVTAAQSNIVSQIAIDNVPVQTNNVIPASATDAWWIAVNPGTYYLNQEEHYYFSSPQYVETIQSQVVLPNCSVLTVVQAQLADPINGLTPMRRVYFRDPYGNFTLYTSDTIIGDGISSQFSLSYPDFYGASVQGVSTDGVSYTVSASASDNILVVTPVPNAGAEFTVSYLLNRSFIVSANDATSALVVFDQPQFDGILITYEGGSGPNVSGLPVHPYYNPRTAGFVYLSSNFYIPTSITVDVDPTAVPADGITNFVVRVAITDAYGSGTQGLPVTVLVGFRDGTLTWQGQTDVFGMCYANIPSPASVQVAQVTATMQLYDAQGNPLSSLLAQTYIECTSQYV